MALPLWQWKTILYLILKQVMNAGQIDINLLYPSTLEKQIFYSISVYSSSHQLELERVLNKTMKLNVYLCCQFRLTLLLKYQQHPLSLLWCLKSGEQLHFAGFMIEGCLEQRERSRVMNTINQRYESLISTKLLSSTFHFHMLFSDEFVLKWWSLYITKYFCLFRFRCIWV